MPRVPRALYFYPSAVFHVLRMLILGVFSGHWRIRVAQLAYECPWFKSPLPSVSAEELVGNVPKLTLYEVASGPGNTTWTEQIVLIRLTEKLRPRALFEFGTFNGRTALNLIAHSPPEAHLYTLDLPASEIDATQFPIDPGERKYVQKKEIGVFFLHTEYAPRITRLYGDSASFDFSPYYGAMDMVFVDASHAYEYVRSDSLQAVKLLRPGGGLVAWHDYSHGWPGVIRALDELYRSGGVFRGLQRVEGTALVILRIPASQG